MDEKLNEIHKMIIELYPDAVGVKLFINHYHLQVSPDYRTSTNGIGMMRKLNGKWVNESK